MMEHVGGVPAGSGGIPDLYGKILGASGYNLKYSGRILERGEGIPG